MSIPHVFITSTSPEKIKATENAWKIVFPNREVVIVPLSNPNEAPSGVSEQPINKDISMGAYNRMMNLKEKLNNIYVGDYIVSYESGIWINPTEDFGDEGTICMILKLEENNDCIESAKSETRRYPYFIIEEARQKGITYLKEQNKLVSAWFKQNPVSNGLTREQTMTNVCIEALKKINMTCK